MELIQKKLIGKDTEVLMTKKDDTFFVSICISNLDQGYGNQLYCGFETELEAVVFYAAVSNFKEQD